MRKKMNFSFFTWLFTGYLLVSGIVFWVDTVQIREAISEAENYKNPEICQSENICREIVQAKIVSSQTANVSNSIPVHKYYSKKIIQLAYIVRLRFPDLVTHEAIILPDLSIKNNFNIPNIYFPITYGEFDNFAEFSFPVDAILKVEVWNGEPATIFTKYINVDSYAIEKSSIFTPIEQAETRDWVEYAVPTTTNPLVKLQLLQDKFDQAITLITITGLSIIGLKIFVKLK